MSAYLCRLTCAAALITCLLPSATTAGPIVLDNLAAGDVFIVNSHQTLTYEDLLVLAEREDNGWHLGWFKHKVRGQGSNPASLPTLDPTGPSGIIDLPGVTDDMPSAGIPSPLLDVTNNGTAPVIGTPGAGNNETGSGDASVPTVTQIPEPGSVLLVGLGIVAIARRRVSRNRRLNG